MLRKIKKFDPGRQFFKSQALVEKQRKKFVSTTFKTSKLLFF